MRLKRLMTGLVALLAAATVATTLTAAGDARPPRIVAAVMQDADGDGHVDRVGLMYSERVRHGADRDGTVPVPGRGLQDSGSRRGEREHGRADCWSRRRPSTLRRGPRFATAGRRAIRLSTGLETRPRRRSSGPRGLMGTDRVRSHHRCRRRIRPPATAMATASLTPRIVHRRIRRSGPERRTRRTSPSSIRTATASTRARREESRLRVTTWQGHEPGHEGGAKARDRGSRRHNFGKADNESGASRFISEPGCDAVLHHVHNKIRTTSASRTKPSASSGFFRSDMANV